MTLCAITGTARLLDNTLLPGATLVFRRNPEAVFGEGGAFYVPEPRQAVADALAQVSFSLHSGPYVGEAQTSVGLVRFAFNVPDAASASFSDCLTGLAAPTSPELVALINAAVTSTTANAAIAQAAADQLDEVAASSFFARETQAPESVQAGLGSAIAQNEAQRALGIEPRRVLINTNGSHVIDPRNFAPALHYILLPAAGSATLDCAALAYNVPYDFISGTSGTTVKLDFGADIFIRSPHIPPGTATVREITLPANQRATVMRLAGNQVFVDYGSPPYEEGTWTPAVEGATTPGTQGYSLRSARWTRVGSLLTFNAEIRMNATSGASGQVRVMGLPFVARGTANDPYAVTVAYQLGLTSTIQGGSVEGGTSHISLWAENGGGSVALQASELTTTTRLRLAGSYVIA